MIRMQERPERFGLEAHGLQPQADVYWNLAPAALVEEAVARGEGHLMASGALACTTGAHTGRSPNDRYIVEEPSSSGNVWWGKVNVPLSPASYAALKVKTLRALERRDLFVRDAWCGADPDHRLSVRVVTEGAWHNLFASNMFLRPPAAALADFHPDWTVLHSPSAVADPATDGTRSGTYIVVHFGERTVLIGGSAYAGEIKKAIFSVMNFLLPSQNVMPMHCSANVGPGGDVALFFGLSGTGKTTLSADPDRPLIGDDEHGWGEAGVFNFEGGCYAKTIHITAASEPEIFRATERFGTVIENVAYDPVTRVADYASDALTENTRSSYPIDHLGNFVPSGMAGHPRNVVFLTADAFGVLPPIARLTPEQAMFHFLSGYTAKVAGTERGVKEPSATFSTCFGAPFMPRHPGVYASMLGERLSRHGSKVWLVNTGWTGGPYGVGRRMSLAHTRTMLTAALHGDLDGVPTRPDPVFGVAVPTAVPGVPPEVLDPRSTWSDAAAYDAKASELAAMFRANFDKYADGVSAAVRACAPQG
ncbi:MAG: phosphoenolpyruvate carboxykinase (ATP) [Ardenticatenales bacterium]|nr:phosphoenolpyruvate carboxykinase (ATP) [Ardenticatenales bacterium]